MVMELIKGMCVCISVCACVRVCVCVCVCCPLNAGVCTVVGVYR